MSTWHLKMFCTPHLKNIYIGCLFTSPSITLVTLTTYSAYITFSLIPVKAIYLLYHLNRLLHVKYKFSKEVFDEIIQPVSSCEFIHTLVRQLHFTKQICIKGHANPKMIFFWSYSCLERTSSSADL